MTRAAGAPTTKTLPVRVMPVLVVVALVAAGVWSLTNAAPALAQEPPPPAGAGGGGFDLGGLVDGFGDRFRDVLLEVIPAVWAQITPDLPGILARGFLLVLGYVAQWFLEGLSPQIGGAAIRDSLLVQTPSSWVQGSPEVMGMLRDVRTVSALLAAALVPIAFIGVYLGLTDPLTAARSSLLGFIGVFAWEHVASWCLDFGNALALALLGGTGGFPGWSQMTGTAAAATAPSADQAAIAAGAGALVFVLAGLVTAVAAVFHLAWVVVLFVLGPLAAAVSVIPAFGGLGKATLVAFGLAVVVKVPGVIVLRLAAAILGAAGFGGEGAAGITAVLVAAAIAWSYTHFLARGARFAGGNLATGGRQAIRAAQTVAFSSDALRQRLAERAADRVSADAKAGAPGKPEMFTHAHPHSHLTGRDREGLEGEWRQVRRPERVRGM